MLAALSVILSTVSRGEVLNGTFSNGTADWQLDGDVSAVPDPNNGANTVARLRTSSPASISQAMDTFGTPYSVEFDAQFMTTTGTLQVMIADEMVGRIDAPDELSGGLEPFGFVVAANTLRGLNDTNLQFLLDGPDGMSSEILLDNIVTNALPEPALSITLDASGQNAVLEFVAASGLDYQVHRSTDLVTWTDHGAVIPGDGSSYRESFPVADGLGFFRLGLFLAEPTGPVSIPIENAGFEFPELGLGGDTSVTGIVPGWTTMAGSGAWHPRATQYPGGAPEGSNISFIQNNNILTQTLGELLEAGKTYTLSALAGRRTDLGYADSVAPDLYLRVGGVKLTPDSASTPIASPGQFTTWTREYTIPAGHPGIGQAIEVVLDGGISVFNPGQINFDTVALTLEVTQPGPVSIDIENAGFELPVLGLGGDTSVTGIVPGWTTMAGSGAWHPRATQYPGGAPEGSNISFIQNNNILTQTLGEVLEAGKTYTLSALAGRRTDLGYPDSVAPDLYLRVGGVKLTPDSASTPIASPGQFTTWTREYTIPAGHPGIGQAIEVVLDGGISVFNPGQINFDTVALTVE